MIKLLGTTMNMSETINIDWSRVMLETIGVLVEKWKVAISYSTLSHHFTGISDFVCLTPKERYRVKILFRIPFRWTCFRLTSRNKLHYSKKVQNKEFHNYVRLNKHNAN